MNKITNENIINFYKKDRELYSNWAVLNDEITHFCNYCTLKTFKYIFDNDGERLYGHFKDCDGIYQKFRTYLTQEQTNLLLINIHINNHELYIL